MYTSCELMYNMENLKESMDKTFPERFAGYVVYNLNPDIIFDCVSAENCYRVLNEALVNTENAGLYPFTALQENPGQKNDYGFEARSMDGVLLEKNTVSEQNLIADVTEAFLDSWEDQTSPDPMWAVFSYDESTVFTVNLREWLTDASASE